MKNNSISENLRYFRNKKGLTQQQLADRLGVSWEMVSRYERGESSPITRLDQLSEILDVEPSLLLNDLAIEISEKPKNNDIPYFNQIPKELDFNSDRTHEFYTAPIWMLVRDKDLFALSVSLVARLPLQLQNNIGPIFVSPNIKVRSTSLVLIKRVRKLEVCLASEIESKDIIIGVVIAQEKRFV